MISYWAIKNFIKNIEKLIKAGDINKAKKEVTKLQFGLVNYIKELIEILNFIESVKIPKELYLLIFQNVNEIVMDLDDILGNKYMIGKYKEIIKKSKISKILENLNIVERKGFFAKFNDIMFDILNFIEHYENPEIPTIDLEVIKTEVLKLEKMLEYA